MKNKPILFSTEMIRALLDGRKTQTRRVIKPQPVYRENESVPGNFGTFFHGWNLDHAAFSVNDILRFCPYGQPGDLLWVRERCYAHELSDLEAEEYLIQDDAADDIPPYGLDGVCYTADGPFRPINMRPIENSIEASNAWGDLYRYRGKRGAVVPSIHMPRWASRLTLRITNVRVERVQDISAEDIAAEGIDLSDEPETTDIYRDRFRHLWDSINAKRDQGKYAWDQNPWVWVIEFEVIQQNVDHFIAGASMYAGATV